MKKNIDASMMKKIHLAIKILIMMMILSFHSPCLLFSFSHKELFRIYSGPDKNQVFYHFMENRPYFPRGLAFDGKNFYIGDIYKERILIVDYQGKYVGEIKNSEFTNMTDPYYLEGFIWVILLDGYFESSSLLKYSKKSKLIFKIDSLMNKKIFDYHVEKDGIIAIASDDTTIRINPKTGRAQKVVPSFWFDSQGYYKLARKETGWILSIYGRKNGKLIKRIKIEAKAEDSCKFIKKNQKIYLDCAEIYDSKKQKTIIYHYNLKGEIDEKLDKKSEIEKFLEKYFDKEYILGYSEPECEYIKVIKIIK